MTASPSGGWNSICIPPQSEKTMGMCSSLPKITLNSTFALIGFPLVSRSTFRLTIVGNSESCPFHRRGRNCKEPLEGALRFKNENAPSQRAAWFGAFSEYIVAHFEKAMGYFASNVGLMHEQHYSSNSSSSRAYTPTNPSAFST